MKESSLLRIVSCLAILLLWFHVADDMVFGLDRVGLPNMIGVAVTVVWLYAALVSEARWAKVFVLLLSTLGALIPALHLRGGLPDVIMKSSGALRFIFTLYAIGLTAGLAAVLAARALLARRTQPIA